MKHSFENLKVSQISLKLTDVICQVVTNLPSSVRINNSNQLTRAGASVSLNSAEYAIKKSSGEQIQYLKIALPLFFKVIACIRLIERRKYRPANKLNHIEEIANKLFASLDAFITST